MALQCNAYDAVQMMLGLKQECCVRTGTVHWTPRTTLLYPAIVTLAGLIAGMFGVGGGIVQGPLMLQLGVPPDVSDAQDHGMLGIAPAWVHTTPLACCCM